MSPESNPEKTDDTPSTSEPVVTDADRAGAVDANEAAIARDKELYGDLSHLTPEQQQKVRDMKDGQRMADAAANSNPGGIPGERYTVERSDPKPLVDGAITGVPKFDSEQ